MPDVNRYANWIVDNQAKKGTEEFETVATAYKQMRGQSIAPTPVVEPEETSILGYGLETGKALLGGVAGLLQSAATGAAFILPEEAEQAARARIGEIGGGVQDFLATDEAYEGTYTDLIKGVGSTLPFLAAAPFGFAGLAVGAFTGITAGAGEAAQRAEAAGATEEEISKAAALGTIPGALEMFGPARIVGRFRKVLGKNADEVAEELSGNIVRKISDAVERAPLGRVGKAAIDEGIQEAITEVGQNLISRGVYDPEQGTFTGTGESFGLGAGVGGLLQGIAEAILPGRQRAATRKAEEAAEKEAAVASEEAAVASEEAMAKVPEDETRDMFPEERAAAEQIQGPEPERLLDVGELAGVTEADPIAVGAGRETEDIQREAEAAVQARYSEAPLSPDAFAAEVANEVNGIRSREVAPEPTTPETDLIADLEETEQTEALVDEDEYADIQAEEDAAKVKLDAAVTQELSAIEIAERENELSSVQQRIETQQTEETQAKRAEILKEVLAQTNTASQVNTEKAFVAALTEAGIGDVTRIERDTTSPIDPEDARSAFPKIPVTEKTSITEAERQAITQKTYELTQQRPEVVEPEVVADGTSVAELEALIPEAGARQAQREAAQTEAPAPTTPVTPEFFDSLGIPKSAAIRRRKALQGKDVSSPEVQEALQALIKNPKTSYQTRANLLNYRAFGEVVAPTAKPTPAAETTVPTAPRTFTTTPQPPAPTTAMSNTDEEKLARQKAKPAPKRGKYTPEASVAYYMQNTTDTDQALRTIAFEGTEPVALKKTSPKDVAKKEDRRSIAATTWVRNNLSPEANTRLAEYKAFYERAENKGDAFVEKFTEEQDARGKLEDEYVEQDNKQDDALTEEVLQEMDVYGANVDDIAGVIDYLRSNAVAATMPLASESVNTKILDGDLKGALMQIAADSSNPEVQRTAKILSQAIKDTKVEFVDGLTSPRGDQFAGQYTASMNLIEINMDTPLNIHTVLHEAGHAVTSKTLDNKAHPVTIQLSKLFNEIKDKIPSSYGTESLKDFVAEAYTNTEFRAILASHISSGSKLTAWQRFTNAVKSLFGMPTTPVQNMEQETVDFINLLMAEAISTRDATTVPGALADNDAARAVYEMMGGGTALAKAKTLADSRLRIWDNAKEFTAKQRMSVINAMTLDNLVDLLDGKLPSAIEFQELIREQDGLRNKLMKDYSGKLNDFKAAFKGDSKALGIFNSLVGRSTIEEVDPTKLRSHYEKFGYNYTSIDGKFVEEITFATAAERDEVVDALDRADVLGGVKKLDSTPERLVEYDEVNRLYNSLTAAQKTTYSTMRDMYKDMNEQILGAIDAKLNALELDENVKSTIKEQVFRKILSSGVIDPYFKLDRTGDFWVEWEYKNADGQVVYGVSAHKSSGEREVAIKRLKENDVVNGESINRKPRPDINAQGVNVPTAFLVDLLDELKKPITITEKDGTERQVTIPQEAITLVNDVLLRSLPEQGLIQGHKERKGFAGYETDAIKTLEDSFPLMINSLANLSFDVRFAKIAKAINKEAETGDNAGNRLVEDIAIAMVGDSGKTDRQVGKLPSYLEFVRNPNLPNWARKLRSSSFIYTLGFNVSSAAVNMSTLPMVVGPLLSGKFGGVKATSAMTRATNMYMQSFGDVTREGINEKGKLGDVNEVGGFSYTNKEGGPLGHLIERFKATGLDTRTISAENADYENPAAPLLNKIAYVSSFIFNHSERAIRQITAASSYILEVEKAYASANKGKPAKKIKDMTSAELNQFGPEAAIVATNFMEYANSSALLATAPRWAQTGPGAIIYQFKRFPAQILYMQMRMLGAITRQAKGAKRTPEQIEEDRALRNAFIYMNVTGGALVGVKGIPFYGLAAMIANMFLGEDEDDANTIVAKTIGDGYFYGAVAKYFGTDVTDRVALTNLMIRDKGNYRPESTTEHLLESYGGPTVGIGMRLIENGYRIFVDDDPRNNQRAWEAILPTAFANFKKAARYSTEGYETTRGDSIVGDVTVGDAIRQAAGFNPAKFRAAQDKLARDRRVPNGIKAMRTGLLDRFAFAHNNGDGAGKKQVIEEIQAFNKKHRNVAIKSENLAQSLKSRAKGSAIAERLGGNVAERRFIQSLLESRRQYGEEL
jgi:hypothetical protein